VRSGGGSRSLGAGCLGHSRGHSGGLGEYFSLGCEASQRQPRAFSCDWTSPFSHCGASMSPVSQGIIYSIK
jgi:hypothetical protein